MPTHVALLRGINLGGRNRVAMADLRDVVTALGHTDVQTYIQSGNVVFTGRVAEVGRLATELEKAIADRLGVGCAVVVVTRAHLARIVRSNPFADERVAKNVHVFFLRERPTAQVRRRLDEAATKGARDSLHLAGRALFLHTPDGYGRSDLAATLASARGPLTGTAATARNWATVTTLLEMCQG